MGERAFYKVQYGLESPSAHGTEVNATRIWLGSVDKVPDDHVPVFPLHNLAIRGRANEGEIYQWLVDGLTLNGPENGAYFQMLPFMFSLFFKGAVSASEQHPGQGDYKWTFTPSLTAVNNPDSATLEYGDNQQAYITKFLMGKRLVLGGVMGQNQAVRASLECFGDKVEKTTFTAGLSKPSITPMAANQSKIYMDALWANKGTTQKTGLLRSWEVEFLNGGHPKFHGNGLTFDAHGEGYLDFMLTLELEGNADAVALYDASKANPKTPSAFEIKVPGPQIGTGDTHLLKLDLWGAPEYVTPMDSDADGDHLYKALIHGLYDPTGAAMLAVEVTTSWNAV